MRLYPAASSAIVRFLNPPDAPHARQLSARRIDAAAATAVWEKRSHFLDSCPYRVSKERHIAMPIAAQALAGRLQGLLSFPVTPFTAENEVDLPRFREHIQYMAGQN